MIHRNPSAGFPMGANTSTMGINRKNMADNKPKIAPNRKKIAFYNPIIIIFRTVLDNNSLNIS